MKYYLKNELGKRCEINDLRNTVFNLKSDLGIEKQIEYVRVGSNFIKSKEEIVQKVISGELRCIKNAEEKYAEIERFIRNSNKITFVNIRKNEEFLIDVDYTKLGRKEERGSIILSELSFACKNNWYKNKDINYVIDTSDTIFGFPIDFENMRFGKGSIDDLVINNVGYEDAPFSILVYGPLINPKIELLDEDKVIFNLNLDLQLEEYESIEYNTKDEDLYIRKINKDGSKENLFDFLDINKNNFFKIPNGTYKLKIIADNDISFAKINVYIQY